VLKTVSEKWNMEFPKMKNLKVHQISNEEQIMVADKFKILKICSIFIRDRNIRKISICYGRYGGSEIHVQRC
jgi:hypothetical protein